MISVVIICNLLSEIFIVLIYLSILHQDNRFEIIWNYNWRVIWVIFLIGYLGMGFVDKQQDNRFDRFSIRRSILQSLTVKVCAHSTSLCSRKSRRQTHHVWCCLHAYKWSFITSSSQTTCFLQFKKYGEFNVVHRKVMGRLFYQWSDSFNFGCTINFFLFSFLF